MLVAKLYFDIKPQAKQSARFSRYGSYADPRKKLYQESISRLARASYKGGMIKSDVPLKITALFNIPLKSCKAGLNFKLTKPDIDNLLKPLLDGLSGIVFERDQQVSQVNALKVSSKTQGIFCKIESLEGVSALDSFNGLFDESLSSFLDSVS